MKHIRQNELTAGDLDHSVVTIGNFDGVHRGHQQVLRRLRNAADRAGLPAIAITFEPHPVRVLHPEKGLKLIHTYATRADLLARAGIDMLVTAEFTPELAQTPAEKWVVEVLVDLLRADSLIIGYDFTFGRGNDGDANNLIKLGREYGFKVDQVPALVVDGRPISSSRIRRLIEAGEIAIANNLLGRPFHLQGEVVHGDGRGHNLGFPTANIKVDAEILPHVGVYGAVAIVNDHLIPTALSVGHNPTFDYADLRVEAHLLDFDEDLYGKRMELHLLRRLRDEIKYDSVDRLIAAIQRDVSHVRQLFRDQTPEDWLR